MEARNKFIETGDKEQGRIAYSKRGLRNLLPDMKKEHQFLKSVHSSPLKNAALRLSKSIEDYQGSRKGRRKGKKTGWPKYRSWSQKFFSLLYDEPKKGFKVDDRELTLSLGTNAEGKRLRITGMLEKSPFSFKDTEIRNLRVTKEFSSYYAIFTVKRPKPEAKPVSKIIAFDPNHKNLAYGVDTEGKALEIQNPWFLKKRQRRIDYLKGRRDRCLRKSVKIEKEDGSRPYWQPSRKWRYFNRQLEKEYTKRREQTKSYLYSVCHYLCKNYDLISVGDYTPKGGGLNKAMRRSMNNESLIGRFKETLTWVAIKSGKWPDIWEERNSTKTCHSCNFRWDKGLSPKVRKWTCPGCDREHIRDENAALNGLRETLKQNRIPCSGHLPEVTGRWTLRFDGLGLLFGDRGLSNGCHGSQP